MYTLKNALAASLAMQSAIDGDGNKQPAPPVHYGEYRLDGT